MAKDETKDLHALGRMVKQPDTPEQAILEPIPWLPGMQLKPQTCVRYTCPEFTSLCPVTGQPDFAHITIDYVPNVALVESKSLKLFMTAFRNHQGFHESTTMYVAQRFRDACGPTWMRVAALWYPRGGIPIDVFWQTGEPPAGVFIPEVDLKAFRGR